MPWRHNNCYNYNYYLQLDGGICTRALKPYWCERLIVINMKNNIVLKVM